MDQQGTDKRRFYLRDGIVIVAMMALVLTAERTVYWLWSSFSGWFGDVPSWNTSEIWRMTWSVALAEASLILLGSVLLRQTDRARLRLGAAGLFVHLAVAVVIVVRLTGWLAQASLFALFKDRPGFYETRWTVEVMNYLRDDLRRDAVIAILASWIALAVVGRWKPEPAWDDRLGRFIGALWVFFYLGYQFQALLPARFQ